VLTEVAEEEGFEVGDQMEITKYLRSRVFIVPFFILPVERPIADNGVKVNALIEKANDSWDERNAEAVERGETELPRMLPLIRLKVIMLGYLNLGLFPVLV
jgi:double-strand break repair protein MRE11